MHRIIKQSLHDDLWQLVPEEQAESFIPEADAAYILPLSLWQAMAPRFSGFAAVPGVWMDADTELEPLTGVLDKAPLVAVQFPAFTDGSGFSTGSLLREVFNYQGELRAFGHLLSDQLGYLRRCGYDSVALPDDQDALTALQQFNGDMVSYQGDVLRPLTPFRRRVIAAQEG